MYHNYIDGEWTVANDGGTFTVFNPADDTEETGTFQQSSEEDAVEAVEAAAAAQDAWANTPASERGAILNRTAQLLEERKTELAETLSREEGKTLDESTPEVQRAIDIFYYYAQKAAEHGGSVKESSSRDANLYTVREPLGVAGLITPWNYPIAIPAWKMAPALATGNTAVIKPASLAPDVSRKVVECLDEAGLPDGVINYVTGPGSEVGDVFATHELVDAVSFTGSSSVGSHVYEAAAEDQKRVQTEMGGKNPTVVTDSADVDTAVEIVGSGAFGVTGQACTACSRAIVYESVLEAFVEGIVDYAESLSVGPGLEEYDMGPQVAPGELEGTLEYVETGREEGATLRTGGGEPTGDRFENGHFVEPTVFTDVDSDMTIAQEEIFGPVLAVIPVTGYEEAIEIANDVEQGLSASIVTERLDEANRFAEEVESGVVKINEKTTGLEFHVPFGGVKESSSNTYREQGEAGMDFFTTTKTVYENY